MIRKRVISVAMHNFQEWDGADLPGTLIKSCFVWLFGSLGEIISLCIITAKMSKENKWNVCAI